MKSIKFILAAAVLLAGQLLWAQDIILTTDHENGLYAKGEQVNVYAALNTESASNPLLLVKVNGKNVIKNRPVELTAEKTVVYSGSFDETSYITVSASATGDFKDAKNYSKIGVVVGAEDYAPGFEEPADFMKFWQDEVKAMRKSKIKAKTKAVAVDGKLEKYADKVDAYDLQINMPEGNPVRAYIAFPKNAQNGSHPIIIMPHGAGVRTSNLFNAVYWAARGCIAIDVNAHGILNGQDKEYYKELGNGELKGYFKREITDRDSFYFRLMYLRMQRVLDYAATLPEWDNQRVIVKGSSQGGGQSAVLAGLDSRVTMAVLQVPALCDMGGKLAHHTGGWPTNYSKTIHKDESALAREVLPYFDGANFLRHTNAKLIIDCGLVDTTCAPEAVISTFNAAASTDKTLYTFPYRNHSAKKMTKQQRAQWQKTVEKPMLNAIKAYIK